MAELYDFVEDDLLDGVAFEEFAAPVTERRLVESAVAAKVADGATARLPVGDGVAPESLAGGIALGLGHRQSLLGGWEPRSYHAVQESIWRNGHGKTITSTVKPAELLADLKAVRDAR